MQHIGKGHRVQVWILDYVSLIVPDKFVILHPPKNNKSYHDQKQYEKVTMVHFFLSMLNKGLGDRTFSGIESGRQRGLYNLASAAWPAEDSL